MENSDHPQATLSSGRPDSIEVSTNKAASNSALRYRSEDVGLKTTINESQILPSLAIEHDEGTMPAPPFFKLPAELRIRIYRHLLHAHDGIHIMKLDADDIQESKARLRSIFPEKDYPLHSPKYGRMTTYAVKADGIHPAILSVNKQTFLEASDIFYAENHFTFGYTEILIPFLKDRSEGSRHLIKQIEYPLLVTELASLTDKFDLAYHDSTFKGTCEYLSQDLRLRDLTLRVHVLYSRLLRDRKLKDYLVTLDKRSWIQQLTPVVKNLEMFKVTDTVGREDDITRGVQTYLESKMHKASQKVRQTRTVQEMAPGAAATASEE